MKHRLMRVLDQRADQGTPARFWWRDDDAVAPSAALDRLLDLSQSNAVPLTLAVIPAHSGQALADRLRPVPKVTVAVHGWAHLNHAGAAEKKQELGAHRPTARVLSEVARGITHLTALHGPQCAPVLVPPWNRIAPAVVAGLPGVGFQALSVFGPEQPAPLTVVNTHVDVMDWHGTRRGRAATALFADLTTAVQRGGAVGLLTHHLVHDDGVWDFLTTLYSLTRGHPGCRWVGIQDLISA